MSNDEALLKFVASMKKEKILLEDLIKILKQEETVFINSSFNELDCLISKKAVLIEQLNLCDLNRKKYFDSQEVILKKETISYFFETCYENYPELKELWDKIKVLASMANQLNHSNGLMISAHLKCNKRAFDALHFAAGNISHYGPKGQAFI